MLGCPRYSGRTSILYVAFQPLQLFCYFKIYLVCNMQVCEFFTVHNVLMIQHFNLDVSDTVQSLVETPLRTTQVINNTEITKPEFEITLHQLQPRLLNAFNESSIHVCMNYKKDLDRNWRVVENILYTEASDRGAITLVTHFDTKRLDIFLRLTKYWTGMLLFFILYWHAKSCLYFHSGLLSSSSSSSSHYSSYHYRFKSILQNAIAAGSSHDVKLYVMLYVSVLL